MGNEEGVGIAYNCSSLNARQIWSADTVVRIKMKSRSSATMMV